MTSECRYARPQNISGVFYADLSISSSLRSEDLTEDRGFLEGGGGFGERVISNLSCSHVNG